MDNRDYAHILEDIAALLKIKGANRFRIRAFENAARTIETETASLEAAIDDGDLTQWSGIGDGIAAELHQIYERGSCDLYDRLVDELDAGLLQLMTIQGLGPKRIKKIYDALGIAEVDDLKAAAEAGEISNLSGFGKKTEQTILDEIERLAEQSGRVPLPRAQRIANSLCEQLDELDEVQRIDVAGSLRRGRETIGDVDLLVATDHPQPIHQAFGDLLEVDSILVTGDTKTSVRLRNGVQVDLRTVAPHHFGSALHYFTGSKEHHVQLRTRAKRQGLKISEYGVFEQGSEEPIASRTERDLFDALDLDFIPPELREGRSEIDAAADHRLPDLIDDSQVQGDLHMHTTETDGRASIEEMARAAADRGYAYLAITDHSQDVRVANGMTPERFAAQIDRIRQINDDLDDIELLSGIEVDILEDGSLDMDHDLLGRCDWVVASIHSHFQQPAEQMTERLRRAIDTGLISCLGHPTGRILGGRDGYDYDFDAVVDAARDQSIAFEINGSTGRLDLNASLARHAAERGATLVLGSDAHSTRGLEAISFAVQQARRAGLQSHQILNCHPLDQLMERQGKTQN